MRLGTFVKGLAAAALASVSLTACTTDTGIVENSSLTVAWNQPLYSFNANTSSGNATANANILYMTQSWFNYYDDQQELIKNEKFGTYELLAQDPMQVRYTVNEGVTWSDGVAVDKADLLLHWAAITGYYNEGDAEYDAETGVIIPSDDVYFDSVLIGGGIEQANVIPELGEDGRTITLSYAQPMVDWELLYSNNMVPAHVVARHALDIEDPAEAKQAVIDAILEGDTEALRQLGDFWNSGFDYTEMPEDEDIVVGSGAYKVTDFVRDEYITLEARGAAHKGGPQTKVETIIVRFIPDALASIQALQNGEIAITLPQATTDVLVAANALDGVVVVTAPEAVYEHLDLTMNSGGPFDPATYDGDAEKAKLVRQAFLTAIDVNEVIDRLIVPIQPDAVWDQSQVFLPGAPGYDESAANNGSDAYGQGDTEAAAALLAEAGVTGPIDVCMLFSSTNTRRVNEYQLYAEQVAPAGFNLVDCSSPEWGSLLGSGTYDVALFGWQSTSTAVTAPITIFDSEGGSNFTGYANPDVDALFDELMGTFDKGRQIEILQEVDALLFEDAYGLTIFQFPGIMVFDDKLTNISTSPLSPQFFWNFWEWEAPAVAATS